MKKILYLVDFFFDTYNSITDILRNVVVNEGLQKYKHIFAKQNGLPFFIEKQEIEGFVCYNNFTLQKPLKEVKSNKKISLFKKIKWIWFKLFLKIFKKYNKSAKSYTKYLTKLIKLEKPDVIVFNYLTHTAYVDVCKKFNIPFVCIEYDTHVNNPLEDTNKVRELETYYIENSKGYFVTNAFYKVYKDNYDFDQIVKYNFPLLIDKNKVNCAYTSVVKKIKFGYFGQIQSFRNAEKIKLIFKELDETLEVFSTGKNQCDGLIFKYNNAVTGSELNTMVASCKYLVIFDNSVPFEDFLPSKVFLYVSFTKPIIIFGDNKDSATIRFFKDYPNCYYQNINEPLDGLKDFLNKDFKDEFDEEIYKNYLDYLPENAVKPIIEKINEILK